MDLLKQIERSVTNERGFIDSEFHAGEEIDEIGFQERLLVMEYTGKRISQKKYDRYAKEIGDLRQYIHENSQPYVIRDAKAFCKAMTCIRRRLLSEASLMRLLEEGRRPCGRILVSPASS